LGASVGLAGAAVGRAAPPQATTKLAADANPKPRIPRRVMRPDTGNLL
jgi:hypothetical protein